MTFTDVDQVLRRIVIAIDGPSGSGKTTTARGVARALGLSHLDTGAMYRCVTLKVIRDNVDAGDEAAVGRIAEAVNIAFNDRADGQRVVLDDVDVTAEIRSPEVTKQVSLISSYPDVRRAMVRRQRRLADEGGVVLEGRDIGSVVLPSADVKVYLDAATDVRALRRHRELVQRGTTKKIEEVQGDIEERDRLDSTREVSPLRIPAGARIIDTSQLSIEEQVGQVVEAAREAAARVSALVVAPGERNPFFEARWVWRLARFAIRALLTVLWGWRVIRKDDTAYRENYIYASNHRSNADPPVVGSSTPDEVYFVAKASLFTWNRAFAKLITVYNAIPLRRGQFDRTAMERCLEILAGGRSVLIFPEGGRQPGPELGKARPGVGYLALQSGCSVVPVYLDGTTSMGRSLFRRPGVTVHHGRPIRLNPRDLERYRNPDGYRDFGDIVLAAIQALKDEHDRR